VILNNIALTLSSLVPRKFMDEKVRKWLKYAGSKENDRMWIGQRMFFALILGLIFYLLPLVFFPMIAEIFPPLNSLNLPMRAALMFISGFFGVIFALVLFYLHIAYVIDGRRKMVEAILPDFLFLVGNNLKSGMTPFYAFRSAVRPEFGPLSEQIQIATQKSLGVESFSDAMKEIATAIDSKILNDTTRFFVQALRSGGKLAQLIEASANDIKHTTYLKKELISSTRMYTIFIIFVVLVASPMLLAVSVQFLHILINIGERTSSFSGVSQKEINQQVGLGGGSVTIEPSFMEGMSYFIIIANSFLASIFIMVLSGGKIRDGVKYAPPIAIAGIVVFNIILGIVGAMLGGMSGL